MIFMRFFFMLIPVALIKALVSDPEPEMLPYKTPADTVMAPCEQKPDWFDDGGTFVDSAAVYEIEQAPDGAYYVATSSGVYYYRNGQKTQLSDMPAMNITITSEGEVFAMFDEARNPKKRYFKTYRARAGKRFEKIRKNHAPEYTYAVDERIGTIYISTKCNDFPCISRLPWDYSYGDQEIDYLATPRINRKGYIINMPLYNLHIGGYGTLFTISPGRGVFASSGQGNEWSDIIEAEMVQDYPSLRYFGTCGEQTYFTVAADPLSEENISYRLSRKGIEPLLVEACGKDLSSLILHGSTEDGLLYGYDKQSNQVVLMDSLGQGARTARLPYDGELHVADMFYDSQAGELIVAINEVHQTFEMIHRFPGDKGKKLFYTVLKNGWLMSVQI